MCIQAMCCMVLFTTPGPKVVESDLLQVTKVGAARLDNLRAGNPIQSVAGTKHATPPWGRRTSTPRVCRGRRTSIPAPRTTYIHTGNDEDEYIHTVDGDDVHPHRHKTQAPTGRLPRINKSDRAQTMHAPLGVTVHCALAMPEQLLELMWVALREG